MLPYEAKYLLSSMGVLRCFDADADYVRIIIADDFASITVPDDGKGMTPFEFQDDFTQIGDGSCRWLSLPDIFFLLNECMESHWKTEVFIEKVIEKTQAKLE